MSNKLLQRIEKLIRLAIPESNAPEPERASAALEACKLIHENNILHSTDRKTSIRHTKNTEAVWSLSVSLNYHSCDHCHQLISKGDVVWVYVVSYSEIKYRHNYLPCSDV